MSTRVEITKKYAKAYVRASKTHKGVILDQVCHVTGWSRDNARRRLTAKGKEPVKQLKVVKIRKPRARRYSRASVVVLERIWAFSGYGCGKYLAQSMELIIGNLESHQVLIVGEKNYSAVVKEELLGMSSATIDRYLKKARAKDQLRGISTTKPGTLLRNSIVVRRAGDEVEQVPGFFECDTVAHCGPTLVGEFARSVNFTDVFTGWVYTRAVRNNSAH